ncbi:Methyltransferase domain-containing protein [Geodermatophilus telluris]|uniref:site-specific DNA-methyltransferase (adenine-specific) n=1 Tax=Geodermatophilus telluris TaxID=1190417 RepID=A0A1G6PFB9_9ACTN|nr:N-6 DNA methylase [Geodermatophilus telluris]SDC78147.1 Methyltransferase domain-containing protein [Geodermatophilus telluris]
MTGSFVSVRVGGGLLPSDVLSAVLGGSLDGLRSTDYHLAGENPREASARVWTHLLGVYRRFRDDLARLPEGDPAVGLTRERWLTAVLSELGYGRVPVTGAGGLTAGDKQYPVSHLWGSTPIHLLGWGVPLDKRTPGVPGAAQRAPHAMVQELLNRTDDYLWAIVSNGRALRLLRDSTTLTGQAYVEFDLEAMFDGELFAEFALLYLLAHQSRVEVPADGVLSDCWLERWRTTAISQGVRALNLLRDGVQDALETLGTGFLQHPANARLREDLAGGAIRLEDLHAALLRTVYRLLFWAVAEDRDALHAPDTPRDVRDRYAQHFSSGRLRRLAVRRQGSAHDDLWQSVDLVLTALGRQDGEPRLGLPGLGGLFTTTHADVLAGARLGNQPLLKVIRSLSVVQPKGQPRQLVDFRHLGAEELGSIYESLLELVPRHDPTRQVFTLETLAGNDRKTTGSYYTPSDLVDLVLDTALDPVLDDAEKQPNREQALLAVTVCDPAIGSGHFMVAAARRIANRLAMVRTEEVDPSPADLQQAMHDVVARCIYGVDLNPMAADLAKVSLWLEAMTPGQPLSFLDHHIKVGNALLGTTPKLLHAGIPDAAYTALAGDDKKTVTAWKKRNSMLRNNQLDMLLDAGIPVGNEGLRIVAEQVAERATTGQTLADVAWAAQRYAAGQSSEAAIRARRTADAWCAAFLGHKTADDQPITHATLEELSRGTAPQHVIDTVDSIAAQHRLFHWHLEFPDIFSVPGDEPANTVMGWTGGFSAMLGNPPWERIKVQEQEFFASRDADIAAIKNAAARKRAIVALTTSHPELLDEFNAAKRQAEATSHFLHTSGRYPLCGVGDVNTYSVFAEHFRASIAPRGRSGVITPTGLATDATTAAFFADTLAASRLVAFYDFENSAPLFDGVHRSFRFAVSSMTGGEPAHEVKLAFFQKSVPGVSSSTFPLEADEILLLNPNTGTLPVFRTRIDAEITLACYRRHPALLRDGVPDGNPWSLRFGTLFHMTNDSDVFVSAQELESRGAISDGWAWVDGYRRWLPLYEAKMLFHWNHRFSTYAGVSNDSVSVVLPRLDEDELDNPAIEPHARYWVDEKLVVNAIPDRWDRDWLLGWRDITNGGNERTFVPSILPKTAVGNSFLLAMPEAPEAAPMLQAVFSSLIFDFIGRQKLSGSHMNYFTAKQLACPAPHTFEATREWLGATLREFLTPRVLELTYNSLRIGPYARDIVGTDPGAPFRWNPNRREQLRAEIDAAILRVYGLDRAAAEHVLDSFTVLRKYEERDHGEFRTKRLVLEAYDAMTEAARTGVPFVSPLDPPPGQGPRHKERM